MNHSMESIKKEFQTLQAELSEVANAFPWEDKEAYLCWMAQSLEYVLYTTRILALTGAAFPLAQTVLAARFFQHSTEEKGHEKLLYADARALQSDLTTIKRLPEAEAFHKSLYYWIYQGRPSVILGWVLLLEGFAVTNGEKVYQRAEKAYGKKPTSFLRVHTAEDPEHLEKAFAILSPLSTAELADVSHGLNLYTRLYENIYHAIAKQTYSKKRSAA